MKKQRHLFSKFFNAVKNQPGHIDISLQGEIFCFSVLDFWVPWVCFFPSLLYECPDFDPKGTITESRERC